jgi:malonyl-CoA/methylmalonyl-CoA synthetase
MGTRPHSIVKAFTFPAERTPDKLCLRFEGDEWTYERLREWVENFAAALRTWSLRPRDRVALFLENCPDFLATYLGTHLAGGMVVPVSSQYRRTELRHILGNADVRLCFTDRERRPEVEQVRGELPDLEAVIGAGSELEDFLSRANDHELELPDGDDLDVIACTSWTTRRSSIAPLLRRDLLANAGAVCDALPRNALGKVLEHEVLRELIEAEE